MAGGERYAERASMVAGATVWTAVADGSSPWILPDGCMDVLWDGRQVTIAGPDTIAHRTSAPVGTTYTALRFASGVAPIVLDVAADGLRDQRPALADVIGAGETDRLTEVLLGADDPARVLERWATDRLARSGGPDRTMTRVAALLAAGRPVADVAVQVGWSERHLHRRSLAAFGYGPKMLARIARLQRAVGLIRAGRPLARVAVDAGYADQSHLAHEVRALTGLTAAQLAANRSTPTPSGSRNVA